jgi:hypothetical protein
MPANIPLCRTLRKTAFSTGELLGQIPRLFDGVQRTNLRLACERRA